MTPLAKIGNRMHDEVGSAVPESPALSRDPPGSRFRLLAALVLSFLLLAGCGSRVVSRSGVIDRDARDVPNLIRIPLVRQAYDYSCGPAALQSILFYYDREEEYMESTLIRELGSTSDNGTRIHRMADFVRSRGYRVDIRYEMTISELERLIDQGKPVMVALQAWADRKVDYGSDWEDGHYAVAIGHNADNIYFMDPSMLGHYAYLPKEEFWRRWHDDDQGTILDHVGMVVVKEGARPAYRPETILPME